MFDDADIVAVFLLQRLPAGKYLGGTLFCWGIATASTAAVKNYGGLLTARAASSNRRFHHH